MRRPDPEPPDDQGAEAQLVTHIEEAPITTRGLLIREPSPRGRAVERSASPTMSSQVGSDIYCIIIYVHI